MTTECFDRECKNRCLQEPEFVCIEWLDAAYQEGSLFLEDINPYVILSTAGWLIKETEEYYSVALQWRRSNNTFRYINHIPKGMVKKITRLAENLREG